MKRRKIPRLIFIGILAFLHLGISPVSAQNPKGVKKGAVHHNFSATWFDPTTSPGNLSSAFFPLYLIHDTLVKPMPGVLHGRCPVAFFCIREKTRKSV